MNPDQPSYTTAELTWGLIIAAMRRIPQEINFRHFVFPAQAGIQGKNGFLIHLDPVS